MRKIYLGAVIIIILLVLASGYSAWQARHKPLPPVAEAKVTMIEGWTSEDMAKQLDSQHVVSADAFQTAVKSFSASGYPWVKKPATADLEGFLFPDTYRFIVPSAAGSVLGKLLDNFSKKLESLGLQPADAYTIPGYGKKLTLYQVLTVASIIEKESGGKGPMPVDEERRLIAGVFYNRLGRGQALEANSTLDYVTKHKDPIISPSDLNLDSPYNTYKYPGLPPSPICNPSLSSIRAAFFPAATDYNYFFHVQPSGAAVFSKTFAEHVKKKQELLK